MKTGGFDPRGKVAQAAADKTRAAGRVTRHAPPHADSGDAGAGRSDMFGVAMIVAREPFAPTAPGKPAFSALEPRLQGRGRP